MTYLIDTDILSMLERKNPPEKIVRWIRENEASIFLSVVSIAELEFGIEQAPASHRESLTAWVRELKDKFAPATEEITVEVLVGWKRLIAQLKSRKRTMTCEDSLIAATALRHGHTIVTRNGRHFEPSGVTTFDPLA